MKVEEIRNIAAQRGIKVGRMNKTDAIRSIQLHEENEDCFATGRADSCRQEQCLWREDCA